MGKLKSDIEELLDKLSSEGRITTLSYEETSKIDRALSEKFDKMKMNLRTRRNCNCRFLM